MTGQSESQQFTGAVVAGGAPFTARQGAGNHEKEKMSQDIRSQHQLRFRVKGIRAQRPGVDEFIDNIDKLIEVDLNLPIYPEWEEAKENFREMAENILRSVEKGMLRPVAP